MYLATKESSQYLRPFSRVGRRLPAYSTSLGKVLLASRLGEELDRHLPDTLTALTPHTLTDRAALDADLASTRERGYAVDNEENSLGLRCFAVALPYAEPASDAISASIPIARLTEQRQAEVIQALRQAADRIARSAGPLHGATGWL